MGRKTIIALAALSAGFILAACSMAPPATMAETTWDRSLFGQGARVEFDVDTAAVTILMAGADDIFDGTYTYGYEDGNIEFYYPGGLEVCSSGTVKGNVMELDGTGSLWGKFYKK